MKKEGIIAHRGGFLPEGPIPEVMDKYSIPENTLEAFKRAFQNGWGIETDIRISGDGNFVVIHDGDIKRFSGNDGVIDQMNIDQIKSVRFKTNSQLKILILEELCQIANGEFIAFQVKRGSDPQSGVAVGRAVAKMMEQYGLKDSILFDATLDEAKILHQEFPWLNLSVSVGEQNYSPTIYTPNQALTTEFTSTYSSVWADEWKIPDSIYNEGLFRQFSAVYKGRIDVISPELHYNENHPLSKDLESLKNLWRKIMSWGTATGICTDYPTTLSSIV